MSNQLFTKMAASDLDKAMSWTYKVERWSCTCQCNWVLVSVCVWGEGNDLRWAEISPKNKYINPGMQLELISSNTVYLKYVVAPSVGLLAAISCCADNSSVRMLIKSSPLPYVCLKMHWMSFWWLLNYSFWIWKLKHHGLNTTERATGIQHILVN